MRVVCLDAISIRSKTSHFIYSSVQWGIYKRWSYPVCRSDLPLTCANFSPTLQAAWGHCPRFHRIALAIASCVCVCNAGELSDSELETGTSPAGSWRSRDPLRWLTDRAALFKLFEWLEITFVAFQINAETLSSRLFLSVVSGFLSMFELFSDC